MSTYRLTHLDDATLLRGLTALAAQDRATTAALLAHIAEVDARRLYLPAAYPSMFKYCVVELHLSEGSASRRIQAARAARRFPRLFEEVADGRLHLTAICLLAPHLTEDNLDELVGAATHRPQDEIEIWLAKRFSPAAGELPAALRARVLPVRVARPAAAVTAQLAAPNADTDSLGLVSARVLTSVDSQASPEELSNQHLVPDVNLHLPSATQPPPPQPDPQLFIVRVPIGEATHAKLRRAQGLLAHSVRAGDLAEVLDRALDALIAALEKRKAAKTARPKQAKRAPGGVGRTIPAAVRREVWERDQRRCTFTSETGRRCESTRGLEFDHVIPHAHGGEATVAGLRLRCRPHNQLEAERVFGVAFMRRKREEAARRRRPERAAPV